MNSKTIVLENGLDYLTSAEFSDIAKLLSEFDIHLHVKETHGPKASLNDIWVLVNEPLTGLIIGGLLMPAVYDAIKLAFKTVIFKIRGKVRILQSGKVRDAIPCLRFRTINGEIIAPIPLDLSEESFDRYMDGVKDAIELIKPNPTTISEDFIVERSKKNLRVEVKTMYEYAQEQCGVDDNTNFSEDG